MLTWETIQTCCKCVQGTRNLIAAAQQAKVKKFALVTSIGTDDPLFPLNLFFGVSHQASIFVQPMLLAAQMNS